MEKKLLKDIDLYLIFSITLFAVLGVSSITPAFPSIIKQFGLTAKQIGYLITVFTFPGIFIIPFMGILADRFGRKTILVPSMLLFGVAGVLCAFQKDYQGLLVMRFFQGIGGASFGSLNVTLIGDLYSGEKRGQAMGYNASVLSIGTAAFPAFGGLLASFNWHYVFLLPGLILPFVFLVFFKLKTPEIRNTVSLRKYLGNVWKTVNRKETWGLLIANILVFISLYGAFLSFFPILMGERFHANSLVIGVTMSLMSLATAFFASQLGRARKKYKSVHLFYFSSIVYATSLVIMAFATNWFFLIFSVILFGMGHGLFIPNLQTALVELAPLPERAAFMSLNGMVLRIGQTLGPVMAALFYFNHNLQPVYLFSAVFAFMIVIIIRTMVSKPV
jgi:MFS transporter, ACDE family, multidrug resistance protein